MKFGIDESGLIHLSMNNWFLPWSPDYGTLKEDLPTAGSNPSLYSPHGSDENMKNDRAREDLYQWMAKQEPIKVVRNYTGPAGWRLPDPSLFLKPESSDPEVSNSLYFLKRQLT